MLRKCYTMKKIYRVRYAVRWLLSLIYKSFLDVKIWNIFRNGIFINSFILHKHILELKVFIGTLLRHLWISCGRPMRTIPSHSVLKAIARYFTDGVLKCVFANKSPIKITLFLPFEKFNLMLFSKRMVRLNYTLLFLLLLKCILYFYNYKI